MKICRFALLLMLIPTNNTLLDNSKPCTETLQSEGLCPYHWLPDYATCESMWKQCDQDYWELNRLLEVYNGWDATRLLEQKHTAERLKLTWYAAWWLATTETHLRCSTEHLEEQHYIYQQQLRAMLGERDFWTGQMPMPLSYSRIK